jgi:hypothetical protein
MQETLTVNSALGFSPEEGAGGNGQGLPVALSVFLSSPTSQLPQGHLFLFFRHLFFPILIVAIKEEVTVCI